MPEVRADIFSFLRESGPEAQVSHILGSWCLSGWDIDRGVAARGIKSWNDAIAVRQNESGYVQDSSRPEVSQFVLNDFTLARSVLPFIITTTLEPSSTFSALNPSSSAASSHLETPIQVDPTSRGIGSAARREISGAEPKPFTSRLDDDPESVEDRNARLRVAAMGALKWIFGTLR